MKSALFTDIHFGAKGNSELHNQDCLNFIDWFCDNVSKDDEIDHIIFLGDWHENRNAVNISTLTYSYLGAKKLNSLGIPIFFIIGNHDLYHRHNRNLHSIPHFDEFQNFIMINEPTVVEHIGDGCLLCPFIFHHEYDTLLKYNNIPVWMGHFEFQGFQITGYTSVMKNGPDASLFKKPKHILSGHFHKRQSTANVTYIGNTFPMSYADANDKKRGMAIYDHNDNKLSFINWAECPTYIKCKLSELLSGEIKINENARINCVLDDELSYEDSNILKTTMLEKYSLREFNIEEITNLDEDLQNTDIEMEENTTKLLDTNQLVVMMLGQIKSKEINNDLLIKLYQQL